MTVQRQLLPTEDLEEKFVFTRKARLFPVVDARPYRWPRSATAAGEYVEDWRSRAGHALAAQKLSKATMRCIASHTSRKDGICPLSDQALSTRSGRSVPSTKRDIGRLKKMGFLIAETLADDGYRSRRRLLRLSLPDVTDEDQRIPRNDDQRIPQDEGNDWGSTYPPYVDPIDMGERRDG